MNIDVERMHSAADAASSLLKTLANRHRLLILCQLVERERSVGELAELLSPARALLETLYRVYCGRASARLKPSKSIATAARRGLR
jgi:DNA-binding transcriptional ArsR family regulator